MPEHTLRSQQWWFGTEYYNFSRRAWMRSEGFTADVSDNRPVIGICNSWSELWPRSRERVMPKASAMAAKTGAAQQALAILGGMVS